MKKETAILMIVIAFLVGFISGATVAILKVKGGSEEVAKMQSSKIAPQTATQMTPMPASEGLPSAELSSKIQALKEMLKKDPQNLSAWAELGNLYFDSDQPREAIDAYSKYLAENPDNPDVRTDMGIMYRKLGNFDRALEEFRKAAQSDPNHINSRYNIGLVLLHDKQDMKGAIKAWEEYLRVDPKSERAERIRSQIARLKTMIK